MTDLEHVEQVQDLLKSRTPFVLLTLVNIKGSAPQDLGAKAIVRAEGIFSGTVGGGKIEARAIREAQSMLAQSGTVNSKKLCTWNLQQELGMTCGGEVSIFFECFGAQVWNIVLFGAGHVVQALVPILIGMDCHVLCIDPRQDWLDRLPTRSNLERQCIVDPVESAEKVPPDAFVCLITQGHSTDLPILKALLQQGRHLPYLGMIGSDTKALRVRKTLREEGFTEAQIAQIRSPIGLPIGRNHPTEIAISILAEMLQIRDSV